MPRSGKAGPITEAIRNLCRDRLNYVIDDVQFKQGLLGALSKGSSQDVGLALAKWGPHYLYLLTDNVDREIATWAQPQESDWAIAMAEWGRDILTWDVGI